jgi:hypothetical protein
VNDALRYLKIFAGDKKSPELVRSRIVCSAACEIPLDYRLKYKTYIFKG